MFFAWKDRATIKRNNSVQGAHFEKNEQSIVYENIPCHLSEKSLSNTYSSNQVDTVDYDFRLFCSPDTEIHLNDVIEVTTARGQTFTLYAGRTRQYPKTCQTSCYFNPVAVGE